MDPRYADAVSDLHTLHRRADLDNGTDYFVPEDKRLFDDPGQLRPIAICDVQVGVAHAANFNLDQNFAFRGFGNRNILNRKRRHEIAKYGSFHLLLSGNHD
jgi:hypothetical protein